MKNFKVRDEASHGDGRTNEETNRIRIKVVIHYFGNHLNVACKVTKIFNRI